MFGNSRIEAQVQANSERLATTTAALNSHLNDCSRRYDDTKSALGELKDSLKESAKERKESIADLEGKVEARHKENKKFFYAILVAVVAALASRVLEWTNVVPAAGHH